MSSTSWRGFDRSRQERDRARRRIACPYDRLVVAPGIDIKFDSVPGYSEAAAQIMPHAWKPGAQTELLVKKLNALKDGDTDRDGRAAQSVSLSARPL